MENKYLFYDIYAGGNSYHTTLEGLVDMILDDTRNTLGTSEEDDGDMDLIERFENGNWTEKEMFNFIKLHGYEFLKVTEELLKEKGISKSDFEKYGWRASE